MNLPNSITVARVALVPLFLLAAYKTSVDGALVAFLLFVVASLSDSLDGHLARSRQTVTRLGEFLDPLADKLLVGAALVALYATRSFPLWAVIVIVAREVAVQLLRARIVGAGGTLPASRAGKLKTVVQTVMVGWWLLPWSHVNLGHWLTLAAAVGLTLYSGGKYMVGARTRRRIAP